MLCDNCNMNQATYHTKVSINGSVSETHLCSDCVRNKNTTKNNASKLASTNVSSFLDGIILNDNDLNIGNDIADTILKTDAETICDGCGARYEEFLKNGLLSCSECYNAFYDKLLPVISTMQHGTVHKGKMQQFNPENKIEAEIRELEFSLKQAVATENYELASELKKKIIELKNLNGGDK